MGLQDLHHGVTVCSRVPWDLNLIGDYIYLPRCRAVSYPRSCFHQQLVRSNIQARTRKQVGPSKCPIVRTWRILLSLAYFRRQLKTAPLEWTVISIYYSFVFYHAVMSEAPTCIEKKSGERALPLRKIYSTCRPNESTMPI